MKYQEIKYVTKPLSKIIFGCAIPSMIQGEDADELLDEVYAQGITTFDTAENYGLSEVSLGHWLKNRGNREKVVIISKGCHPQRNEGISKGSKHCTRTSSGYVSLKRDDRQQSSSNRT